MEKKVRLAKKIAESGIASRREAERLIEAGRVEVDGEKITTPVFFVTDQNKVLIDGKEIGTKSEEIIIWKFHKPKGTITTKSDPKSRKTVFDFFGKQDQRLLYVGRLDYNSEGLLLFTNNGDVARKMELPSTGLRRTYRVRIFGKMTYEIIQKLKEGIIIDGVKYGSVEVELEKRKISPKSSNTWIVVTLSEGKNREIRKIMEYFGCIVNRLIRISYGPIKLGKLPAGAVSQVTKREIEKLLKEIKFKTMSSNAGLSRK